MYNAIYIVIILIGLGYNVASNPQVDSNNPNFALSVVTNQKANEVEETAQDAPGDPIHPGTEKESETTEEPMDGDPGDGGDGTEEATSATTEENSEEGTTPSESGENGGMSTTTGSPDFGGSTPPRDYNTTTESSDTRTTTQSSELPENGSKCQPLDCKLVGFCKSYKRCNNETGEWEELDCAEGLYWNYKWKANYTGGSCDRWEHLDKDVQDRYNEAESCRVYCYFQEIEACSNKFNYFPPGKTDVEPIVLDCPPGLYFSNKILTCNFCSKVLDKDGKPCICPM